MKYKPSGSSTAEMANRPQPGLSGFMLLDHITPLEGGLPIFAANKELVGAIGLSGAPGGDKDTACAQVSLDKIAGKLWCSPHTPAAARCRP